MNQDKVNVKTKLYYSLGAISDVIMANIIMALVSPIYVTALGVSPVLIGWAISIPRLWEAFTDPIIGNISDNTRSRLGRRRPYLFFGAFLGAILCAAIWMPPTTVGTMGIFTYFFVISILFFTAHAIFSVPYNAIGYEMTENYNERTSVMSYKTFVMNIGSVLLLPWAYKLCRLPQFGDNEIEGVRVVGIIFGVLIFIFGLLPALLCRENLAVEKQEKIKLLSSLKYTFSNKSFIILSMIVLLILMGIFLVFPLMYYINLSHVFPVNVYGEEKAKDLVANMTGIYGTVYGAAGLLFVPLVNFVGQRFDKRYTLLGGLGLIMTGFIVSWFLFTPDKPYLQLLFALLVSPGLSCVWILTASMMADVCDQDELDTGLRREGIYGAVFGFLVKLGVSLVLCLSGYILQWTGYDIGLLSQSDDAVLKLRIFFVFLPFGFLITAFILTAVFPLTKAKMQEIRQVLDERKQGNTNNRIDINKE